MSRRADHSWFCWSAVVWLMASVAWSAEGSAGLRIATYNVRNYTAADRMVREVYRPEYPKPENEKSALRAVIKALDADVLALQEMGGEPYARVARRVRFDHVIAGHRLSRRNVDASLCSGRHLLPGRSRDGLGGALAEHPRRSRADL